MNTQNTLEQLKGLKLTGMAKSTKLHTFQYINKKMSILSLIAMLTQAEVEYRITPEHRST
jgi:hypothetical protein